MPKRLKATGRNIGRLGRQQLQSVQGAAAAQDLLLRNIDALETGGNLDPILEQGLGQAIRSKIGAAETQARARAGLGGQVDPFAAAGALSQGLLQREQMRVRNQQRRLALLNQQTSALVQQTQAGFKGAPVDALISADASITQARIAAEAKKGGGFLGTLAGIAGGVLSGPFGAALGSALFKTISEGDTTEGGGESG